MNNLNRLNRLQESFESKADRYMKKGDRLSGAFYRRAARDAARLMQSARERIGEKGPAHQSVRQFWPGQKI